MCVRKRIQLQQLRQDEHSTRKLDSTATESTDKQPVYKGRTTETETQSCGTTHNNSTRPNQLQHSTQTRSTYPGRPEYAKLLRIIATTATTEETGTQTVCTVQLHEG